MQLVLEKNVKFVRGQRKCEGRKERIPGEEERHTTLKRIFKGEGGEQKVRIVLTVKIKCMTGKLKCGAAAWILWIRTYEG